MCSIKMSEVYRPLPTKIQSQIFHRLNNFCELLLVVFYKYLQLYMNYPHCIVLREEPSIFIFVYFEVFSNSSAAHESLFSKVLTK